MKNTIRIFHANILIIFLFYAVCSSQPFKAKKSKNPEDNFFQVLTTVGLNFIDPGVSPFSDYRWRDVAGNLYSDSYRENYGYDNIDVQVQVTFEESDVTLHGQLSATGLKPNFAYQLKLNGFSGTAANERIGLTGRWWQEEWDGAQWTNGQNLNNKGDGSIPNPNDLIYFARRDEPDSTSPTGLNYRYTGYLVFDYFITDENGNATLDFEAKSSYHVLWNTIQQDHTTNDGPTKSVTFDPDPDQPAYDTDYPSSTMTIFGEWERLPVGDVCLAPGAYDCQIVLTEESFHGWPCGSYTGLWSAVMGAFIQFTVEEDVKLPVQLSFFEAESGNSCVFVSWVTESELNNAGFEVLKSFQKTDSYVSVSDYRNNPDLMGHGNSSIRHEYLYIDSDVLAEQSYWYYLVDFQFDGKRTYHGPVQVYVTDNNGLNNLSPQIPLELKIYPNFLNSPTFIEFSLPIAERVKLEIYNIIGQKIVTVLDKHIPAGSHKVEYSGQNFSSGVYLYRIQAGKWQNVKKMIVFR